MLGLLVHAMPILTGAFTEPLAIQSSCPLPEGCSSQMRLCSPGFPAGFSHQCPFDLRLLAAIIHKCDLEMQVDVCKHGGYVGVALTIVQCAQTKFGGGLGFGKPALSTHSTEVSFCTPSPHQPLTTLQD